MNKLFVIVPKNKLITMKKYKRDAVFSETEKYCVYAKQGDFIEVTRWHNADGFDVIASSSLGETDFKLTYGQFKLLKKLLKELNKDE